jgi:hypothetical protein
VARRRSVPLALLAVLTLLTVGAAVLALTMAPNSADLAVHNATAETFSGPQFSLQLIDTVAAASGTSQTVRVVDYRAPDRMVVYRATPTLHLAASLHGREITTAINQYLAVTGGSTNWVRHGSLFSRTESLRAFEAGQQAAGQPEATGASGTVAQTAIVRGGYLVAVTLRLKVEGLTEANGQKVAGGTALETVRLLRINGAAPPAIGPLAG